LCLIALSLPLGKTPFAVIIIIITKAKWVKLSEKAKCFILELILIASDVLKRILSTKYSTFQAEDFAAL
jgi:hypothetical protein